MIAQLNPEQCWDFLQKNPDAVMIDVRTTIEHHFVGHPPDAILIAWQEFPGMRPNVRFVQQVEATVADKNTPLLLLCRSGGRSLTAANVLQQAGYQHLINITEGFEGDLNQQKHRGCINGWRFRGYPWVQS